MAGRSDIDTFIVLNDQSSGKARERIVALRKRLGVRHSIPKGLGAIVANRSELFPPYDPERELVREIIRLKQQGRKALG